MHLSLLRHGGKSNRCTRGWISEENGNQGFPLFCHHQCKQREQHAHGAIKSNQAVPTVPLPQSGLTSSPVPCLGFTFCLCRNSAEQGLSSFPRRNHFNNRLECHDNSSGVHSGSTQHHHHPSPLWFLPHTQQFYLYPSIENFLRPLWSILSGHCFKTTHFWHTGNHSDRKWRMWTEEKVPKPLSKRVILSRCRESIKWWVPQALTAKSNVNNSLTLSWKKELQSFL